MRKSKRFSVFAGGIAVALAASGAWAAAPPTQQELMDKINALQAEVNQMRTDQAQEQADEAKVIQQVLNDANQHSQLFDTGGGLTAGWDDAKKQFYIASDNGDFYFHPGLELQVRYIASKRDSTPTTSSNWQDGFEIRRAKFYFNGTLTKDLAYDFQWQDSDLGGGPTLEYGWGQYTVLHDVGPGNVAVRPLFPGG
jgi:hypothetical protein